MSFQPVSLAQIDVVRALFQFALDDIDDLMSLYNPVTGVYEGTESRYNDSKTRTVQVGAQTSYGIGVDLAAYPLSVFASYVIPIEP